MEVLEVFQDIPRLPFTVNVVDDVTHVPVWLNVLPQGLALPRM